LSHFVDSGLHAFRGSRGERKVAFDHKRVYDEKENRQAMGKPKENHTYSETGIRYTTRKSQRLLARLKLQRIMAMWKWALKIIQDGEMPFPVGLSSDGFSKSLVDLSFDT
jgi:hypothetical protein